MGEEEEIFPLFRERERREKGVRVRTSAPLSIYGESVFEIDADGPLISSSLLEIDKITLVLL